MSETLSISKIADLAKVAHLTARKRLLAGGAVADSEGRYSLPDVLQAWERLASCRVGSLDATEAKTKLANLKIEEQTIELRRIKGELVELRPWEQYMAALTKCLWVTIQSLNLDHEGLDHCRNELNRVTTEFVQQNLGIHLLTLDQQEEQKEFDEQGD